MSTATAPTGRAPSTWQPISNSKIRQAHANRWTELLDCESPDTLAILLEMRLGLNPNAGDALGNTPAMLCATLGHDNAILAMAQHIQSAGGPPFDFEARNHAGYSPVHVACLSGRVSMLATLFQAGFPLSSANDKVSALSVCAKSVDPGALACMAELLRLGCPVDEDPPREEGHYPGALWLAAFRANPPALSMLLDAGARPDGVRCSRGNLATPTALHAAVGQTPSPLTELCIRMLLAAGAPIEARDGLAGPGRTPLQTAARRGFGAHAALLLQAGADPLATDNVGHNCIEVARAHGHLDVADGIEAHWERQRLDQATPLPVQPPANASSASRL